MLSDDARHAMATLLELLQSERGAPSAVRDPADAWRLHVQDSLSGLVAEPLRQASAIADVGAGAGFPGLVLAAALPSARMDLIESVARKCEFMRLAIARTGIANAGVVCARAESWAAEFPPLGGREGYDAVCARAVGRLATLAELASPLLRPGGHLIAWKGRRDEEEEAELKRAGQLVAMALDGCHAVGERAGSRHRHIYTVRKSGPTPHGLPRRPGMAKKAPYGASRGKR